MREGRRAIAYANARSSRTESGCPRLGVCKWHGPMTVRWHRLYE